MPERACSLEHLIQLGVVDGDEPAVLIDVGQPEPLADLHAGRAQLAGVLEGCGHARAVAGPRCGSFQRRLVHTVMRPRDSRAAVTKASRLSVDGPPTG